MREIGSILLLLATAYFTNSIAQTTIDVVPKPDSIVYKEGAFIFSSTTILSHDESLAKLADYLSDQMKFFTGISPEAGRHSETKKSNFISLSLDSVSAPSNPEGYMLDVSPERIALRARTEAGLFSGIQTLLQLFPVVDSMARQKSYSVPCCTIIDYPRFEWRGLNLDCCRHFITKDFIKRYIDLLAYYKFNVFHWHLTDDQGWRIEIKQYPKLTQIGAWRKDSNGNVYGGFYTQEDIKEIVAYAQSRFITVVPEIEMPGHCMAALAAYPEYSCTGGPFQVPTAWGIFRDVYCPGKDSTFTFLDNILSEVMTLFPSHYIHIGGDEVLKDRWKACPYCQRRIKDEGLKDENELQSYFVKRIDKFVESKGREIIGWDEILQGGLAPGATVQSWRGIDGAIQAAQSKHNTIVSPGDYAYLSKSPRELPLDTVYSFEPVPAGLSRGDAHYVLGTEANMWTEHAPQDSIDSKMFPRLLALSEVAWTQPAKKNYDDFHGRLDIQYNRLAYLGVDYGLEEKAILFKTNLDTTMNEFNVSLTAAQAGTKIHYTLDGSMPTMASTIYETPIIRQGAFELIARSELRGHLVGNPVNLAFMVSKAINAAVTLKNPYSKKYSAGGPGALVNGVRGTMDFDDGLWQGYDGVDVDAVIDLGKAKEISQAGAGYYQDTDSWIFLPDSVEFSVSNDGINFTDVGVARNGVSEKEPGPLRKDFVVSFDKKMVRYIKMEAKNIGVCPPWHEGAGGSAWVFIDEIFAN